MFFLKTTSLKIHLKFEVLTDKVPHKHVSLEETTGFDSVQEELLQGRNQTALPTQQDRHVSPLGGTEKWEQS